MLKASILPFFIIFFEFGLFPLLLFADRRQNRYFNLNSNKWKNLMQ